VQGLRREEVALLAGVSADYYTRLERGNLSGVSEAVLEALAKALQLDETERRHLFDLARASQPTTLRRRRKRPRQQLRPAVEQMLEAITTVPVHHPLVGELNLNFEAMELVADPGLTMFVYTAEPGSKTEQALNLLGSWTATPDEETAAADHQDQPRHERRP
jgi:transcriptional regulator with XRE-family HTH domain